MSPLLCNYLYLLAVSPGCISFWRTSKKLCVLQRMCLHKAPGIIIRLGLRLCELQACMQKQVRAYTFRALHLLTCNMYFGC